MRTFKITLFVILSALSFTQIISQCAPGPFSVDPASAAVLDCLNEPPTDFCAIREEDRFSSITIPAGMQFCVELPVDGYYQFGGLITTDVVTSLFDSNGILLDQRPSAFISYPGNAGETICLQVESVEMGICQGTNSANSEYSIEFECTASNSFVQVFTDPMVCQLQGFNMVQTLTDENGLDNDNNLFVFDTGTLSANGAYTTGSLTICARGNFRSDDHIWVITDESGNCVGGFGNFGNSDCTFDEPLCTSFNFDMAEISTLVGDGTVSFDVSELDDSIISSFCSTDFLSLELNLCAENSTIPTMGEWGLVSLGLILMSLSIVDIKQSQFILN